MGGRGSGGGGGGKGGGGGGSSALDELADLKSPVSPDDFYDEYDRSAGTLTGTLAYGIMPDGRIIRAEGKVGGQRMVYTGDIVADYRGAPPHLAIESWRQTKNLATGKTAKYWQVQEIGVADGDSPTPTEIRRAFPGAKWYRPKS